MFNFKIWVKLYEVLLFDMRRINSILYLFAKNIFQTGHIDSFSYVPLSRNSRIGIINS